MKKLLLLLMIFSTAVFCSGKGKITGKVTDSNGDPLIGANVTVVGTSIGAATNLDGKYTITVKPGTYSLEASYIGFKSKVKNRIKVREFKTTKLDFKLEAAEFESEALYVVCDEAMMTKQSGVYRRAAKNEFHPNYNTEEYDIINENNLKSAAKDPLSTFAIDTDGASYANVRRMLMYDEMPHKDVVRIEELINYFDYDYSAPNDDKPFRTNIEYSECPWDKNKKLLHIGLKAKKLESKSEIKNNLVFLIDVSGSMDDSKKLPLLKKSFKLMVNQLTENDKVSIVVYAGAAGVVLPATRGSEKAKIINALESLNAGGSTAGGEGIKLAYKIAKENFIKNGNNRVILATDGDFNVGVSSTAELVRFVEKQKHSGIFLTALGFGMGNYKDNKLQQITNKGDGNHYYIDSIIEAKKVLVNEINSTFFTVAKDVKIQIEFNPAKVSYYRLIGYENRLLNNEDFEDDKKDGGEIGAEHSVTAIYEIIENDGSSNGSNNLKYQQSVLKDSAFDTDEILTLKIRYKKPEGTKSTELIYPVKNKFVPLNLSSDNFRFAAAVAEFGLLLRDSEYKGSSNFDQVLKLANNSIGKDVYEYRKEFVILVKRAKILSESEVKASLE